MHRSFLEKSLHIFTEFLATISEIIKATVAGWPELNTLLKEAHLITYEIFRKFLVNFYRLTDTKIYEIHTTRC